MRDAIPALSPQSTHPFSQFKIAMPTNSGRRTVRLGASRNEIVVVKMRHEVPEEVAVFLRFLFGSGFAVGGKRNSAAASDRIQAV
jgi:hypothetical protein